MHIDDALQEFVTQLQADGRRPLTVEQYARHIRLLGRWLADRGESRQVEDIDHRQLAAFLASSVATHGPDGAEKTPMSINALRSSLRVLFRYLYDAGVTKANAARLVRRARGRPAAPRALTDCEQERLLAAMPVGVDAATDRDRMMFQLMLGVGLRLGSTIALEARDIDLERGEIRVRHTKGDQPMTAVIPTALQPALRQFLQNRGEGPLFITGEGRPITARHVQRRLTQWLTKAGLPQRASPHSLRHSYAMRLYQATGDLALVQRALGHQNVVSTAVYARCDDARLRRALNPV